MRACARLAVRRAATSGLLLTLLVALGCGGGVGDVSGTVTYNGKPLDGGSVQYRSGGKTVAVEISKDGKYSVSGIPAGAALIAVSYVDPRATDHFRAVSAASKAGGAGRGDKEAPATALAKVDPTTFNKVPDKYNDFNGSGLTFEVKKGSNTYDIDLK